MENQKDIAALKEQFLCECEVIEMRYEYGKEFTGYEKYGIVTDLSEEKLRTKYGQLLSEYEPYILLSCTYGEVRKEYIRNDKKFEMRAARGQALSMDDRFDEHNPELEKCDILETVLREEKIKDLHNAIQKLKPMQRERLIKHFYYGMSSREIAKEEGRNYSAVDKSIISALKNLKKFLI